MKKMLTLLLMCTCIFACNKDENAPGKGNGSYSPDDKVTVDAAVMYTGDNIIHDQALIKDYITRRGNYTSFIFDATTASGANLSSFSLEFGEGKNVLLGITKAEIISKTDTSMMLAEMDLSQDNPKPEKTVSDSLVDLVQLGGPVTECPAYYTAPCKYRKKYPLQIQGGKYYLPYVVATATSTTWEGSVFGMPVEVTRSTHRAGQIMLFNKDVISKIGKSNSKDTLVVQSMRRELIMQ